MPKVTSARKSAQPLPQQPRATTSPLPTDQTGSTSASANHHSVGYPSYPYPMQPYGGYGYLPPPPGYPYSSYPPPSSAPLPGSSAGLPHHGHLEQLHDEDHGSQAGGSVKRGRGGSGDEDEGESKGKRKKRLPLSCGECSRRKIKCDRKSPCSACVRRKRTEFCSFDDEDPVTPYAMNSDVRAIGRRLAHLESLFQQHAPHLFPHSAGGTAQPSPASASTQSHTSPAITLPSHLTSAALPSPANGGAFPLPAPAQAGGNGESEELKRSISDTEDAVADLEEKTFEARVPVLQALHAAAQGSAKRYNYVKVADMELTSALTTILAEPLTFDQDGRPRSAVRLGLDLAVSPSDIPAVRHEALSQVYAVLPDTEIAQALVAKYFNEMEWDFRILDPVAFPIEYERFVQMRREGREDLVDPLWVAVFCMVLALSLDGFWSRPHGAKDLSLFRGMEEGDLKDLPSVWHDAALRALQLGEWGGTPRVRTIQTILLMVQYIQIASSSGQQGRILTWVSAGIRVAQRMGLHRLGSNPETMPPDDPALPPGKNSLKRETGVRLWWMLVGTDAWLSDSPSLRCYLLHPSQYNTARPLNLNSSDLSRTSSLTPPPQPLSVYTDASFELLQVKIGEQIRRSLDSLVLSEGTFSYPAVLEQNRAFHEILQDAPDVFSERNVPIDSPRIAYQRACLHEDIYSRIVRLNRPLLGRGYAPNSPYAYSKEQCIEAAKKLISSNFELLKIETSRWWMYTGTLTSSIVIMMDVFQDIDHDAAEQELREKREILMQARAIFETREIATPALTVVVDEARKILSALFVEEERRRTTRAAHVMAGAEPPKLETFADVLKRVSRAIATQEAPNLGLLAAPPLPPSLQNPPSAASFPPFSFAQAAATAMAATASAPPPTPTSATPYDPLVSTPSLAFGAGVEGGGAPALPDFSGFFNLTNSEDWTAFGSPGDDGALLDQLAATW